MNINPPNKDYSPPKGVMTEEYAINRTRKPSLAFRFKARALESINAYKRFSAYQSHPSLHIDFGAADGLCSKILHEGLNAKKTIGIEYTPEIAAFSKYSNLPNSCELVVGDIFEKINEFPPSSVDVITALAFLEHISDPIELFRQSYKILRPNGLFIATCPEPFWDKISGSVGLHKDEHHEQEFTRKLFNTTCESGGLHPLAYKRFMNLFTGFMPYLHIPVSPSFASKIDSFFRLLPSQKLFFVNQLFVARKN